MEKADDRLLDHPVSPTNVDLPPPYEDSIREVDPDTVTNGTEPRDEKTAAVTAGRVSPRITSTRPSVAATSPLTSNHVITGTNTNTNTNTAQTRLTRQFSFSTTPTGEFSDAFTAKEICPEEQPGLELVETGNFDKIACNFEDLEVSPLEKVEEKPFAPHPTKDCEAHEKHKKPRRKRSWILPFVIISSIVAIGTALGIGLDFGLKDKHESSTSDKAHDLYASGGSLNPAYFSTKGAFNGSGIALAQQSFQGETQGTMVLYYQHYTGTIRAMQLRDGDWLGGSQADIVAYDAKNGTPLSTVAYAVNGTSTWHVFYIDTQNRIRQRSNSNQTNIWQAGSINSLNLVALDSDAVGMQACWYGNFFGDSDYTGSNSPLLPNGQNATGYVADVGMHLWYASDENTFHQYGWRGVEDVWEAQDTWTDMNGHAGVACYSWGPGTVTYTMMTNKDNTVEIWWKDTDTNLTSTTEHPINVWTNSSVAINNAYQSTSLGYTAFLYDQDATSLQLNGYNISYDAENTKIVTQDNLVVDVSSTLSDNPLPGTHFAVTALDDASGGQSLLVFYQTVGNDITMLTRDILGGAWTYSQLPVDLS